MTKATIDKCKARQEAEEIRMSGGYARAYPALAPDFAMQKIPVMKGNKKLFEIDRMVPLGNPKLAEKFTHEANPVSNPRHYTDTKISPIEYMAAQSTEQLRGFCVGNAIKYLSRAGKKDPAKTVEDLEKAVWYIQYYIEEIKMLEAKNE